ncbi:hypothetical protein WDV76_16110 [Xenorhabdus griffiniae]|uniref:hypothetical protein n=1 Tax=Xenorhabdus griffiniae TaxID=351672 RepID=UPI0030D1B42E
MEGVTYNVDLAQKYNITDSYPAKYVHKKGGNHSLHTGLFDDGVVYSLYTRNGRYMILVDVFKNPNEANKKAQDIINEYQKLKKYFISKEREHNS